MKKDILLLIFCIALISCKSKKKDSIEPSTTKQVNWEIVKQFNIAPKHFDKASLAVIADKVYLSAHSSEFGNRSSHFFFENTNGMQNYEKENEQFVVLKPFGGTLYGIMEYTVPYMAGQVQTYRFSYYLYRWGNNQFENIAKLDFIDQNGQKDTMLQNILLWEQQQQLYFIAQQSNGESLQWNITSGNFKDKKVIGNTGLSRLLVANNEQISFTRLNETQTIPDIIHTVQGAYYNGNTLRFGPIHTFKKSKDGSFDNTSIFYAALENSLFGYVKTGLKNLDQNQTITNLTNSNEFSSAMKLTSGGKIYSTLTDNRGNCKEISVFNGKESIPKLFNLPDKIDKCAIILDVFIQNDKLFLAIMSNRQLYVLKEK